MTRAYYNEIDPYAAAWLRNLIADGHIAAGDVDERSVVDVTLADLAGYSQCHFFAGIGGWSLALRLAGWPDDRPVWTGSCPCQPFSTAGKGGGFDDARHLWPVWFNLIREYRPRVVFGEQVASPLGLGWLDAVHADMEGEGYAFAAVDLCSAGIGAPHIRQRLGFVADASREGSGRDAGTVLGAEGTGSGERGAVGRLADQSIAHVADGRMADAVQSGRPEGWAGAGDGSAAGIGGTGELAHSEHGRREARQPERRGTGTALPSGAVGGLANPSEPRRGEQPFGDDRADGRPAAESGRLRLPSGLADADQQRQQQHAERDGATFAGREEGARRHDVGGRGRHGGMGDSNREREDTERGVSGRSDSERAGSATSSRPGPTNGPWRDADWLLCRDGKWRPVEPGTFPLAHGISGRVGRLRAYGNAINPHQFAEIIAAFADCRPSSLT